MFSAVKHIVVTVHVYRVCVYNSNVVLTYRPFSILCTRTSMFVHSFVNYVEANFNKSTLGHGYC